MRPDHPMCRCSTEPVKIVLDEKFFEQERQAARQDWWAVVYAVFISGIVAGVGLWGFFSWLATWVRAG